MTTLHIWKDVNILIARIELLKFEIFIKYLQNTNDSTAYSKMELKNIQGVVFVLVLKCIYFILWLNWDCLYYYSHASVPYHKIITNNITWIVITKYWNYSSRDSKSLCRRNINRSHHANNKLIIILACHILYTKNIFLINTPAQVYLLMVMVLECKVIVINLNYFKNVVAITFL